MIINLISEVDFMSNINIEIPDNIHQQLKLDALSQNKTLKLYIKEILEKHTKVKK